MLRWPAKGGANANADLSRRRRRVQRNRKQNALTILLVPHSERAPVSLRLPFCLVPLLTVILVTMTVAAVVFAFQYYSLQQRMNDLLDEQALERVRQREMRATVLSQQDEVRSLSSQVESFKAELLSVRRLSDEIRDILGLPRPAAAEPVAPSQTPATTEPGESWEWPDGRQVPMGGQMVLRPSARSMRVAMERGHELLGMRSAVPAEVQALEELRELVLERLSRIDEDEQGDWESLQRALRQWAAAPHLWPVHPHVVSISSQFGYREFRGMHGFHYGIDVAVPIGTRIRATKEGVVTTAAWRGGYGWVVEVDHEAGYSTLYAHNSKLLVKAGDRVKAGDVIALSGSSGYSTGPHLHYEIRLFGTPVDPLRYIDEG
jgi:hypothetical protein